MPAYNAEKYIARAIDSIRRQTVSDWWLVIVNDCSTDDTLKIAREYAERDSRIQVCEMPARSGSAYEPRRKAIESAETEYVAPLDADDWIDPDYLERMWHDMTKMGASAVYPTMYRAESCGDTTSEDKCQIMRLVPKNHIELYDRAKNGKDCVLLTLNGWKICCNGGIIPKQAYLKAFEQMQWDTTTTFADELLTRILLYNLPSVCVSEARYYYFDNSTSITKNLSERQFDFLQNNLNLMEFCGQSFGRDSEEYIQACCQQFYMQFSAMRLLNEGRYSTATRKAIERKVAESRDKLDFKLIRPYVGGRYYRLVRMPMPGNCRRRLLQILEKYKRHGEG